MYSLYSPETPRIGVAKARRVAATIITDERVMIMLLAAALSLVCTAKAVAPERAGEQS